MEVNFLSLNPAKAGRTNNFITICVLFKGGYNIMLKKYNMVIL